MNAAVNLNTQTQLELRMHAQCIAKTCKSLDPNLSVEEVYSDVCAKLEQTHGISHESASALAIKAAAEEDSIGLGARIDLDSSTGDVIFVLIDGQRQAITVRQLIQWMKRDGLCAPF